MATVHASARHDSQANGGGSKYSADVFSGVPSNPEAKTVNTRTDGCFKRLMRKMAKYCGLRLSTSAGSPLVMTKPATTSHQVC
jgi:hypothetical protein